LVALQVGDAGLLVPRIGAIHGGLGINLAFSGDTGCGAKAIHGAAGSIGHRLVLTPFTGHADARLARILGCTWLVTGPQAKASLTAVVKGAGVFVVAWSPFIQVGTGTGRNCVGVPLG
jgi:hypothetical protein